MATLTASDILAKRAAQAPVAVDVPEWGGTVYVKRLTAAERDQFETLVGENKDNRDFSTRAALLVYVLTDETGKRLYDWGMEGQLAQLDAIAVDRVFKAAAKLNGLHAESVDDAEKN